MMRRRHRAFVTLLLTLVYVLLGGWMSHANADSGEPITIKATLLTPLLPGTASDLRIEAYNPNADERTVSQIVAFDDFAVDAAHAGCKMSALHFSTPDNLTMSIEPASSTTLTIRDAVSLGNANKECNSATLTFTVSATTSMN